jgi:GTP-binding protein
MVIVNKWDLVANKSDSTERKLKQEIRSAIRGLPYVPLILASATTQVGISRILETALQIFHERYVELDPESLKFICKSLGPDILKVKQHGQNPPRFFAQSALKSVPVAYPAIVEKAIRRRYPFLGTPLIISVNKKIRHYVPSR